MAQTVGRPKSVDDLMVSADTISTLEQRAKAAQCGNGSNQHKKAIVPRGTLATVSDRAAISGVSKRTQQRAEKMIFYA